MKIRIPQYLYHDIREIKCVYIHVYLYQQSSKCGTSKDGAVKWLRERERERFPGFSHRRHCFDTRPFYVGFVLNMLCPVRISLRVHQFFPLSNLSRTLYISLFITHLCNIHATLTIGCDLKKITKKKQSHFVQSWIVLLPTYVAVSSFSFCV